MDADRRAELEKAVLNSPAGEEKEDLKFTVTVSVLKSMSREEIQAVRAQLLDTIGDGNIEELPGVCGFGVASHDWDAEWDGD